MLSHFVSTERFQVGEQQLVDLQNCILLGKLVGTWGVEGWLKVFSYTRPREKIGTYKEWLLVPSKQLEKKKSSQLKQVSASVVTVRNCREQGQNIIAQIEGVHYKDQAEALFAYQVYINKNQLKPLQEGEHYWSDMIGCKVTNADNLTLGIVTSILETGANDVLVVHQNQHEELIEHLIPYSNDIILSVDSIEKAITVDWGVDYLMTEKNKNTRKKKYSKQQRVKEIRLKKQPTLLDADDSSAEK